MKSLTVLFIALFSLNVFSAEVGEDKKGECIYADQSKREAKIVESDNKEVNQTVKQTSSQTKSK